MKRLLPLLIFLLICSFAQTSSARMNAYIAGCGAASSGCNPANEYIGYKTNGSTSRAYASGNNVLCNLFQASCTGNVAVGHIYHDGTTHERVKVCLYSTSKTSASTDPDTNDTLHSCSAVIDSSTDNEDASGNMSGTSLAVTKDNYYWACLIWGDITYPSWTTNTDTGASRQGATITGAYATPPSTLDGTWTETADRKHSMWVTIGE